MTHYFTWNNPRILLAVSLVCVVLLAQCPSLRGDGVAHEINKRWMEQQANVMWNTPTLIFGAPDTQYADCSLEGFACFEYAWNATPLGVGEGWTILSVNLGFTFFSATLGNLDDRFEIQWGIGNVSELRSPDVWTILDVVTAGSAPMTRIYNVTADIEIWTFDDIYNIYLQVQGFEEPMGPDDLVFFWDSGYIEYGVLVPDDPVPPDDPDDPGSGGVKDCDFQPTIDAYRVTFQAWCDRDDALILHWIWDFGDGSTLYEDGSTAEHEYSQTGTFNVSLEVIDFWGHTASVSKWITIEANSPSGFYWSGMVEVMYWVGAAIILMVILVMLARRWKKKEET